MTDVNKSLVDKIALESAKDVLASLSRMTYILIGLFLPAFIVLLSGDDQITLLGLEIAAGWVPLITIALTYVIILHGCRCLSILAQFLYPNPKVLTINPATQDALKALIKTHEWPFNPFVDFQEYKKDEPLKSDDINKIRWRTWSACLPLFASFLLSMAYICVIIPISSWAAIVLLWVIAYILRKPFNMYTDILGTVIERAVSEPAKTYHSIEVEWIKTSAKAILVLVTIGLILWELSPYIISYLNSRFPIRQYIPDIQDGVNHWLFKPKPSLVPASE